MQRPTLYAAALVTALSGLAVPAFADNLTAEPSEAVARAEINQEVAGISEAFGLTESDQDASNDQASTLRKGVCSKVKLTDEQKSQLKDQLFQYAKDRVNLQAAGKIAKLNYAQAILSDATQRADADTAGAAVTTSATNLAATKVAFTNKVLFDVLTPEQRKPGFLCMVALKKHFDKAKKDG